MAGRSATFVTVLCTGRLMEFDMAVDALREAGIAYQAQAEASTGLKEALPITPDIGPGSFLALLVPANAEAEARGVLSHLPFETTTNPGPWHFRPRARTVKRWRTGVIIALLAFVVLWIMQLFGW